MDIASQPLTFHNVAVFVLPWIVSGLGIWMTYLTGNKDLRGWLVGLAIQVVWFVFVILTAGWGFLPLNIVRFYQYYRNYRKWKAEGMPLTSPEIPADVMVPEVTTDSSGDESEQSKRVSK